MKTPRTRLIGALAVTILLASACSSTTDTSTVAPTAPQPSATATAAPTTAPPASSPPTSAPVTTPLTQQEAYQVVFAFDPMNGDPAVLAAALEVAGAGPGLGLPLLVENGSPEVQDVVLDHLGSGSSWGVTTLVAMQEYGTPSGTYEEPKLWPSSTRLAIAEALRDSSGAAFGALWQMMIDLNRRFLAAELDLCAAEGCEWGAVWYGVPGALANPDGKLTDSMLFEGSVTVVSDTGAGDSSPIIVRRLEGWVPVEGYLSAPPAFGLASGGGLPFDGSIVTKPTINVAGWAELGTTIRIGGDAVAVDDGWWEMQVTIPNGGIIEIVGEAVDGTTRSEELRVRQLKQAERTFGYVTGIVTTDTGDFALEVDYAEWLTGEAATAAAREDGVIGPDDFIENDYYIRNRNPLLRTIPVDIDAAVRLIDAARDDLASVTVPLDEFVRIVETGDDFSWYGAGSESTPFWFVVDGDSLIYQIEQQYIP